MYLGQVGRKATEWSRERAIRQGSCETENMARASILSGTLPIFRRKREPPGIDVRLRVADSFRCRRSDGEGKDMRPLQAWTEGHYFTGPRKVVRRVGI